MRSKWPWIAAAVISGAVALTALAGGRTEPSLPGSTPNWNMDISAGGHKAIRALVYGKKAGVHFMKVEPAEGTRSTHSIACALAPGPVVDDLSQLYPDRSTHPRSARLCRRCIQRARPGHQGI